MARVEIWRIGERFLVERGPAFALVESNGSVAQWFEPREYSDEDDLWRWTHVVVGDRFYERTTIERFGRETACDDRLVLGGLVGADDRETRAFIAAALRADRVLRDEARLGADREGEARVKAIVGALDDRGLCGELARARDALAERVRAYDDRLAAALLGTLEAVARARPGAAVITAYARGCLLACFDSRVPELHDGEIAPLPELASEMAERTRELQDAAESQEYVDALANARAYRRAAEAVGEAARLAGGLPAIGARKLTIRDAPRRVLIPRTRLRIGLTPDEADALATELAKMEEALHEPGLKAFDVFDFDGVRARRREWLETSMPAHDVEVGPFEIDVYPVTNARWMQYAVETGAPESAKPGSDECFVTGVSWQDAAGFAKHYGLDLPSEAEWECATRHLGSFFTWGNEYFPQGDVAFSDPQYETYPVGSRPQLASARGVHDLLGQFGEYCRDPFAPYQGADRALWERHFPGWQGQRVVRGGFDFNQDATCVSRHPVPENERRTHLKFRCARRP